MVIVIIIMIIIILLIIMIIIMMARLSDWEIDQVFVRLDYECIT